MTGTLLILAAVLIATGGAILALSLQRRVPLGLGIVGCVMAGACIWMGVALIAPGV